MFKQQHTEYSKQLISASMSGKTKSEEHRRKLSESHKATAERKKKIAENLANGRPWNYGIPHDEKFYAKILANRKRREEKKLIEKAKQLEEKERLKQEKARLRAKEQARIEEEILKHAHDDISPEEWNLPMIVIAERRNITIEEINEIFYKQITKKTSSSRRTRCVLRPL